ncbi:hypothetical protein Vi05172_g6968 [Venturia inaequalis]|nr:hypothetical protein Vi05172_g6968 [Venturia inaequalis]
MTTGFGVATGSICSNKPPTKTPRFDDKKCTGVPDIIVAGHPVVAARSLTINTPEDIERVMPLGTIILNCGVGPAGSAIVDPPTITPR